SLVSAPFAPQIPVFIEQSRIFRILDEKVRDAIIKANSETIRDWDENENLCARRIWFAVPGAIGARGSWRRVADAVGDCGSRRPVRRQCRRAYVDLDSGGPWPIPA